MAYILWYVDDIIFTASSDALRCSIIALLSYEFAIKNLGRLNYFLCIVVTIHKGGMFLSQRKYTDEIIERAGMSSCKPTLTPIDSKPKVSANSNSPYVDPALYRSLAGALHISLLSVRTYLMLFNKFVSICIIRVLIILLLSNE